IEHHTGFDREKWPVTGGVPFPKGADFKVDQIGISGTLYQKRILCRWADGSIKWESLAYQKDISASRKVTDQVLLSEKATTQEVMHTETDDYIIVDTGTLKFIVSKKKFGFLDEVWLDLNKNGVYEPSEQVVKSNSGQGQF